MADVQRPVTLAAVTGAHGVAGEVRLKLFGEGVETLRAFSHVWAGNRRLTLVSVRPANQGAVARLAEVADRTAAEALRGTALTVPRDQLPPLGDGEYYHHDLIGLPVVTPDGAMVGTVVAVDNFGASDVLEIARPAGEDGRAGKRFMVPMTPAAVPTWDAERLVIDPAWTA